MVISLVVNNDCSLNGVSYNGSIQGVSLAMVGQLLQLHAAMGLVCRVNRSQKHSSMMRHCPCIVCDEFKASS